MQQLAAKEIGARIALARKEAGGLTQEQLGDLINVTMRSVQNYESGGTIPWKHFQALSRVLDKPVEWFIHGEREDPDATAEARHDELLAQLRELHSRLDKLEALVSIETGKEDRQAN